MTVVRLRSRCRCSSRACSRRSSGRSSDAVERRRKATALALGPGLGRDPESAGARAAAARGDRAAGGRRRRRALRARAVRRDGADGADAARGRAGPAARTGSRPGSTRTGSRPCGRGAERFGCVCLLKGADTLVAAPGGGDARLRARAAFARDSRHGDVLTGVIAAFLAKGVEPARGGRGGRLRAAPARARRGRAARPRRLRASSRMLPARAGRNRGDGTV